MADQVRSPNQAASQSKVITDAPEFEILQRQRALMDRSSNVSDTVCTADNSPYLRSKFATQTNGVNLGNLIGSHQLVSNPAVSPIEAAGILLPPGGAVGERKLHTSNGAGCSRRKRYQSSNAVQGVDLFRKLRVQQPQGGDNHDMDAFPVTTTSSAYMATQHPMSTKSSNTTRIQHLAQNLLQQKLPGMRLSTAAVRTQRPAQSLHSGHNLFASEQAISSQDKFGSARRKSQQSDLGSFSERKRHHTAGRMARGQRRNIACRTNECQSYAQRINQVVASFAQQSSSYNTHSLAEQYEKNDQDSPNQTQSRPKASQCGGWSFKRRQVDLATTGMGIGDMIPDLNATLNYAGQTQATLINSDSPVKAKRKQVVAATPVDFGSFSTKGAQTKLVRGEDDYTRSYASAFKQDRNQAKHLILNRMQRGQEQVAHFERAGSRNQASASRSMSRKQPLGKPFINIDADQSGVRKIQASPNAFISEYNYLKNESLQISLAQKAKAPLLADNSEKKVKIQQQRVQKEHERRTLELKDSQKQIAQYLAYVAKDNKQLAKKLQDSAKLKVSSVKTLGVKQKPVPSLTVQSKVSKISLAQTEGVSGPQEVEKQVDFVEDTGQMIRRLLEEALQLRKDRNEKNQKSQVENFFEDEIYTIAERRIAEAEKSDGRSHSTDSFNSVGLMESSVEEEDGCHVKEASRRLDKHMKNAEKNFAKAQGIKGFYKKRMKATAFKESERVEVLAEMILDNITSQEDQIGRQTLELQRRMTLAPQKDAGPQIMKSDFPSQSLADHGRDLLPQNMNMSKLTPMFKLQGDATKEVGEYDTIPSQGDGPECGSQTRSITSVSSDSGSKNNAFFEEFKAEQAQFQDEEKSNLFSDESDIERQLIGTQIKLEEEQKQESACATLMPQMTKSRSRRLSIFEKPKRNVEVKETEKPKINKQMGIHLKKMVDKIKFNQVLKQINSGAQSGLDQTPAFVFQRECNQALDLMLPIVEKIRDDRLVLQRYTISKGQLSGLSKAILTLNKPVLHSVFLDDCCVTDENFVMLLEALEAHRNLQELVYKRDEFLKQSLERLKPILSLDPPRQLLELRLVNCETAVSVMISLCDFLGENKSFLRVLTLSQMGLNFYLGSLAKMVTDSQSLQDLDLSGNDLMPVHFAPLLAALAMTKTLHYVNLAYNTLISRQQYFVEVNMAKHVESIQTINETRKVLVEGEDPRHPFLKLEGFESIRPHDMVVFVVQAFGHMIRYNTNLQTVHLESTGLNQEVILGLVPFVRHAKSLICLHLAQNPGITKEIKEFWMSQLKIAPREKQIAIDVMRDRDDLERPLTASEQANMTENDIKIRDYKVANFRRWLHEEAVVVQKQRHASQMNDRNEVRFFSAFKTDLTIQRILGHSATMPGSAKWRLARKNDVSSCWACGNWTLALVFWSQEIGIINSNNNINIQSSEKKRIIEQIRLNDPDYMTHPSVPMLFSNGTNWKGKPFMPIIQFMKRLIQKPDFTYQATEMIRETLQIPDMTNVPEELKAVIQGKINRKKDDLAYEFYRESLRNMHSYFTKQFLRFGKVMMINFDKVEDPDQTFVLPIFFKPGRTHFILRTPEDPRIKQRVEKGARVRIMNYQTKADVHFKFYYNRHVVPTREERIPPFKKVLKKDLTFHTFNKKKSVFHDWVPVSSDIIDKVLQHDFEHWKVSKFVKSSNDLASTKQFIKDNWCVIEEIRVGIIAHSNAPPQLNEREFWHFCEMANIPDESVTRGVIDSLLIATNSEPDSAWNDARKLVRYEFLEVLVRIAYCKYIQPGHIDENNIARALHRLCNEHILAVQNHPKLPHWERWRQKILYTNQVNDLIEVNMGGLRAVYQSILEVKQVKRQYCSEKAVSPSMISIDQVLHFVEVNRVGRDPQGASRRGRERYSYQQVILSDRMLRKAFYLSKMTIVDEGREGSLEFTHLKFVEFLEFIGRISWLFFSETAQHFEWPLEQKIKVILTWAFRPKGLKVRTSQLRETQAYLSESDDDY